MCFIDTNGFQAHLEGGRIVARELDNGLPLEKVAFDCDLVAVAEAIDESVRCVGVPRTVSTDDGGLFEVVYCPTTLAPNGERLQAEGLDITIRTPDGDTLSGFLPHTPDDQPTDGGFCEVTDWAFVMGSAVPFGVTDRREVVEMLRFLAVAPGDVAGLSEWASHLADLDDIADAMTDQVDVEAACLLDDIEQFELAA